MENKEEKEAISGLADQLGVASKEVWKIFVRQYLVQGLGELVTAGAAAGVAYYTYHLGETVSYHASAILPAAIGLVYLRSSLPLMFNPGYYAAGNIVASVKNLMESPSPIKRRNGHEIYY